MILHSYKAQIISRIVKCVSFLLVFVLLLSVMSAIFVPKSNDVKSGIKTVMARGIYGEPRHSLDIIEIGNSNIGSSFSPMELWKEYGYTGYNCAEAGQTIFEAYNMLSEVLACQKPKVVILDSDGIFPTGGSMDTFNKFLSFNLDRYFPAVLYHDRWKKLNTGDFRSHWSYNWTTPTRGYWLSLREKPFLKQRFPVCNPVTDCIGILTESQMDAFERLCRKNGAKLVLVYVPTVFSWNQVKHNDIAKYAFKHGLPFIDLNSCSDNLRLNWETDTVDGGTHLNYNGAKKVTLYIGDYLHRHYSIPDHRKDQGFKRWNDDYKKYKKLVKT